jgi:hypothetical protein
MAKKHKQVAFDVTPDWWQRASSNTRQLIVAAAGALVPQRLDVNASVFAVGNSVFAYDIDVPEDADRADLAALRSRIVEEIDAVRELLPSPWRDSQALIDTARWFVREDGTV